MSLSTSCPHCGKSLKLKSRSAIGKQAPCPSCGEVFTIELAASASKSRGPATARSKKKQKAASAPADDFDGMGGLDDLNDFADLGGLGDDWEADDYGDDLGDDADDFGLASAGQRTRRRSASSSGKGRGAKKKRSKSGSGTSQWAMMAGGAVAVLLLVGGITAALFNAFGGENVFDLTWVPDDADALVRFDPAGMANSPIAQKASEVPVVAAFLEAVKAQIGDQKAGVADISEVVLASTDSFPEYRIPRFTSGKAQLRRQADPKFLVIVRFNRDLTLDDLFPANAPNQQRVEKNGHQCVAQQMPNGKKGLNWLADSRTLIGGTEEMVVAAMDRGPKEPRLKRFDFARPMVNHHVLAIFAPKNVAPVKEKPDGPDPASQLEYALDQHATGILAALNLTTDVNLTVGVNCRSSGAAQEVKTHLDAALADAKSKFQQARAQMTSGPTAGMVAPFVEIAEEAINSLQVRMDGRLVVAEGRLPGRIVDEVKKTLETNPMLAGMSQVLIAQFKAQARRAQKAAPGRSSGTSSAGGSPASYGSAGAYGPAGGSSPGTTPPSTAEGNTLQNTGSAELTPQSYGSEPTAAPTTPGGPPTAGPYDKPPESLPQTPMSVGDGSYDTPPDGTPTETPMGTPASYDAPPGAGPSPGVPPGEPAAGPAAMQRPGRNLTPPNAANLAPNGEPDPAMTLPPEQAGPAAAAGGPARPGAANAPKYVRVDIEVRSYRGSGSVDKAALRALGRVIGVQKDSIKYDRTRRVLSFVQRFDEKVFNEARTQLARARIQLGRFQVTSVIGGPDGNATGAPNGRPAAPAGNRNAAPARPQRGLGSPPGTAPQQPQPPGRPGFVPPGGGSAPQGPGAAAAEPEAVPAGPPSGFQGGGSQP